MFGYAAPLADMRFVLSEIANLEEIATLPGHEDMGTDLVDAILDQASRFAGEVLAPLNVVGDRQGCVFENGLVRTPDGFKEAYAAFVEGGWNSVSASPQYGGQGLPAVVATAISEMWSAANMAFALCPLLTRAVAEMLEGHGSESVRNTYLPKLVSGEWTGTMNLTEPQAGSDLALIRTRAVRHGDHYRLSGQKIFLTYGEHDIASNIIHMVLARTPGSPPGVKGLSLFLVPKFLVREDGSLGPRNDVRCVSIERKLGIRGSPTAVTTYGDGDGAIGYLIGEENAGIEQMFFMMNSARLAVGLQGIAMADRAYQHARAYAFERVQGRLLGTDDPSPVVIARHGDVQRMLMSMKSQTEAARALAYFVAGSLDMANRHPLAAVRSERQHLVDLLTPVVKAWSTDIGIDAANTAIQVHGGMGYMEDSGVPQYLRDARIAAIYEGTNGIQANDLVGRKVARDKGQAATAFIAGVRQFIVNLAGGGNSAAGAIGRRLEDACNDLEACTRWIVETYPTHPRRVAAGAVHYLRLLGIVAGGWLMAKAVAIAEPRLSAGLGNRRFLEGKIASARFFADNFLTQSGALRTRFLEGSAVLDDFEAEQYL
jgi:alkylation response protein AidB-like acyl-CoA dehydrogenase